MAVLSSPRFLAAVALAAVCQALPRASVTETSSSATIDTVWWPATTCTELMCPLFQDGSITSVEESVTSTKAPESATFTIVKTLFNPSKDEPPRLSTSIIVLPYNGGDEAVVTTTPSSSHQHHSADATVTTLIPAETQASTGLAHDGPVCEPGMSCWHTRNSTTMSASVDFTTKILAAPSATPQEGVICLSGMECWTSTETTSHHAKHTGPARGP